MDISEMTIKDVMIRWPRIVAHLICHSLGYATPSCSARIILDYKQGRENWCEWIYSCYDRQPKPAIEWAIKNRHTHHGYMADYGYAYALVMRAIEQGKEPELASWF